MFDQEEDEIKNDSEEVIRKLLKQNRDITVPEDCLVGVGYTMCTDLSFKAIDLFNELEPAILELEKEAPLDP